MLPLLTLFKKSLCVSCKKNIKILPHAYLQLEVDFYIYIDKLHPPIHKITKLDSQFNI